MHLGNFGDTNKSYPRSILTWRLIKHKSVIACLWDLTAKYDFVILSPKAIWITKKLLLCTKWIHALIIKSQNCSLSTTSKFNGKSSRSSRYPPLKYRLPPSFYNEWFVTAAEGNPTDTPAIITGQDNSFHINLSLKYWLVLTVFLIIGSNEVRLGTIWKPCYFLFLILNTHGCTIQWN